MSFTSLHLFYDDLNVNQEWESPGRTITEADIVNFAGLSGDFNPIHMDHAFARTTAFRRPIAHGLLVFSISSGLALYSPAVRTQAFLGVKEWHFRGPVFVGDTIRVLTRLVECEVRARGRRAALTWERKLFNQDGKVVQEGITNTLVEGRASLRGEKDAGEKPA